MSLTGTGGRCIWCRRLLWTDLVCGYGMPFLRHLSYLSCKKALADAADGLCPSSCDLNVLVGGAATYANCSNEVSVRKDRHPAAKDDQAAIGLFNAIQRGAGLRVVVQPHRRKRTIEQRDRPGFLLGNVNRAWIGIVDSKKGDELDLLASSIGHETGLGLTRPDGSVTAMLTGMEILADSRAAACTICPAWVAFTACL